MYYPASNPIQSPTATLDGNVGPPLKPGNRCGHCGRFIKQEWGWEAFDKHINEECPIGGYFSNGALRRRPK